MNATPWVFRRQAGFSLTEVMVVIVVFGIIALISLPNLQDANHTYRLKNATSQLEATLRRARTTAVTQRTPVRITLSALARTCQVQQDRNNDGIFETNLRTFEISDAVSVDQVSFNGQTSVTFDERGAPNNPGTVVLTGRNGFGQQLLVSAGSGSVVVSKYVASGVDGGARTGY